MGSGRDMFDGLQRIAERGDGDFVAGLTVELQEMAREVDEAVGKIMAEAPLTKIQARKAVFDIMRKGYKPTAGAEAILSELRKLKAQGLRFDENGIAQVGEPIS